MGRLTEYFGYLSAKPQDLAKFRMNMSRIEETERLKKLRRKLKAYKK